MYIQFTKDINKIRNILFLGRTFREICIFTVSGFIAFLSYHITKRILPGTLSLYVIVPTMLVAKIISNLKKLFFTESKEFYSVQKYENTKRKIFMNHWKH